MAGVIHFAEVAAILALAYAVGWAIGYVAHRLLAARTPVVVGIPAERTAAVVSPDIDTPVTATLIEPAPSAPALSVPTAAPAPEPVAVAEVAAPQPAPTPAEPEPVVTAVEPVQTPTVEPVSTLTVDPEPEVAGLTPVAIPIIAAPPPLTIDPVPERRPAPPFERLPPPPAPEPEVVLTAAPASKPGVAWSGQVRGNAPEPMERPAPPPMAAVEEDPFGLPPENVPLTLDLGELGPDSTYGEPVLPPAAEIVETAVVSSAPDPTVASLDEDSAMRAIEGGWSRVGARAPADAPELSDVGAAVAAAQTAVEQVLAQAGIEATPVGDAARPRGLPRPRLGQKDDLKRIDGVGALDESTLNNLGVYHFDQIAGWTAVQVLWMEDHVFARGRIRHENWQQQARELAAPVAT